MILWIDKNTFAATMLEKIFRQKKIPFYTVSSVTDFGYLVEDLAPRVIVLDGATYADDTATFLKQFEASPLMQKTPFIFLDAISSLDFTKNKIGEIKRPFDPFKIPQTIEELLNAN